MYVLGFASSREDDTAKQKSKQEDKLSSHSSLRFGYGRCSTDVSLESCDSSSDRSGEDELPVVTEGVEETFFDCRSQASAVVNHDDEIARYCHETDMCVYADGSPAMAPPGTCVSMVSYDFLDFHDFDEAKAKEMWEAMLKWRQETEVWKIHRRPNPRFDIAKEYYPSCYHGFDREDATVLEWSFPGGMVPQKLVPDAAALDEILYHVNFMQEYLFCCLYTDEGSWKEVGKEPMKVIPGQSTTRGVVLIIDVKGAGISLLTTNVFTFLKRMIHQSTSYYPAMAKQVIIVNSPFWVAGVFKTIKPLIPDGLPVEIVSEQNTLEVIRKYVDDDQIPVEYGGSSPYPLHHHPFERRVYEKAKRAASYGCQQKSDPEESNQEDLDDTESINSISTKEDNGTDSFSDENPRANVKPSLCTSLPFSQSLPRSQERTFVVDPDCDDWLDLTPNPPRFDSVGATNNIWKTISQGFASCGVPKSSH